MRNYEEFIARKARQFGARFDPSELDPRFIPHYEAGQRIKIVTPLGEELAGCIGVGTSWRPSFILIRRFTDRGPSYPLSPDDRIVAVRINFRWIEVPS